MVRVVGKPVARDGDDVLEAVHPDKDRKDARDGRRLLRRGVDPAATSRQSAIVIARLETVVGQDVGGVRYDGRRQIVLKRLGKLGDAVGVRGRRQVSQDGGREF